MSSSSSSSSSTHGDDLEWEEWDGTSSTFWQHCVAGSLAGVAEHVIVYPLDTIKTHLQCAMCPVNNNHHHLTAQQQQQQQQSRGNAFSKSTTTNTTRGATSTSSVWKTVTDIMVVTRPVSTTTTTTATATSRVSSSAAAMAAAAATTTTATTTTTTWDPLRLWRGVQTILIGCIPAHALYFSSYEAVKYAFRSSDDTNDGGGVGGEVSNTGVLLAGAAATVGHDIIMTPLDTMKQRLQLGRYNGSMVTCCQSIFIQEGGWMSLYRSLPITLLTNVPYGMIMVWTNEWAKQQQITTTRFFHTTTNDDASSSHHHHHHPTVATSLWASSLAGAVAAACTTPLDRIKTTLQTQRFIHHNNGTSATTTTTTMNAAAATATTTTTTTCPKIASRLATVTTSTATSSTSGIMVLLDSTIQAIHTIARTEGVTGFLRGMGPRIASHTPAVAISWTTYETAKRYLVVQQQQQQQQQQQHWI